MKILFNIIFILVVLTASGQNYGNIWMLGNNSGIDFTGCVATLTTSNNDGFEGCSTFSDSNGQLLFYTNSDNVWNRNHNVMSNGSNIFNSLGTLSQVLIIPRPQSVNQYYIFTTSVQGGNVFQYHTVDMTLDGGLGDLIAKNDTLYNSPITEQVCATYHSNGFDIWVLMHEYGTNNFHSYLVTNSGVNSVPVISSTGPAHPVCNSNMNARGEIKFSPDGSKLAFNGNGIGGTPATSLLTLFDFNNTTGVVSNPIDLPFSGGEFGLSFSPDNSKLYGTTWKTINFPAGSYNHLYQFDLSSGVPQTIISSKQIIDSVPGVYGTLKLAPDGKIYVRYGPDIGIINSPNLSGANCNYVSQFLSMGGNNGGQYGLNNYIEYTQYCNTESVGPIDNQNLISIYPNPSSNIINIHSEKNMTNSTITIFNSIGQTLSEWNNIYGYNKSISIETYPTGLYFIHVDENGKTLLNEKMIKD